MNLIVCHKSIDKKKMTCAGAVAVLSKVGRLPVIARLGLVVGVIAREDIAASAAMVIDPSQLAQVGCKNTGSKQRANIC